MKYAVKSSQQSYCSRYSCVGGGVEEVQSCFFLLSGWILDPTLKC